MEREEREREKVSIIIIKHYAYWKKGRKEGRNKKRMITQKIEY